MISRVAAGPHAIEQRVARAAELDVMQRGRRQSGTRERRAYDRLLVAARRIASRREDREISVDQRRAAREREIGRVDVGVDRDDPHVARTGEDLDEALPLPARFRRVAAGDVRRPRADRMGNRPA